MLTPWKESYDQPRQHIRKQRHYFANKGPSHQGYGFSSSHVWMWELDYKESWVLNSWCFWTVVMEKTFENPLDCKEIEPVYPKGDQSWVFTGRTDVEAETPILWPPDAKNWLLRKDQPSHPLLSPSPPAPNPSQHQSLFQWVNSSHEVAKVLEFQL